MPPCVRSSGSGARSRSRPTSWSARGDRHRIRWETAVLTGRAGEVTRVIVTGVDVTAQRNAEHALRQIEAQSRHASLHDPLTGLANRALLTRPLHQGLTLAARTGRPVAVLFVDLDRFKLVNDTCGHARRRRAPARGRHRLRAVVRAGDTVARIGGDEFVVLLEARRRRADRGRGDRPPSPSRSCSRATTARRPPASASPLPEDGTDRAAVLRDADPAMYRAKDRARPATVLRRRAMPRELSSRLALETDLRRRARRGQLVSSSSPRSTWSTGASRRRGPRPLAPPASGRARRRVPPDRRGAGLIDEIDVARPATALPASERWGRRSRPAAPCR